MKYRVKLDLAFTSEADARNLMNYAKTLASQATSLNEGKASEEIGYADIHLCGHDESPPQPCQPMERVEVRKA
ncbi:MAG: hypothetical protein WC369_07495 [Dehalococcoidales bacterium]